MSEKVLQEFLNPKSMLTPGVAGATTLLITNTLAAQFSLPPNYTGLIISFAFGLLVFAGTATVLWLRAVFYLLNSLLIFSVALGANQVGVTAAKSSDKQQKAVSIAADPQNMAYFSNWLDGTVPRRKELIAEIDQLNDRDAKQVLQTISGAALEGAPAKPTLMNVVANIRTREEAEGVTAAIENLNRMAWEPKPRLPGG